MDLTAIKESMFPKTVFKIFGLNVNNSVLSGFIVVAFLLLVALIIRIFVIPKFKLVPSGFQILLESIVNMFTNMSDELVPNSTSKFLSVYTFSASAYICFGVLIELTGLRPVFSDINACLAVALSTFILINVLALKAKGVGGRFKYYFPKSAVAVAGPIRMLTDLAVPVSMTFRLFGSILSGMMIMELIYSVLPIIIPAFLSPLFTLFHALIQSYIFSALSLTFIGEAVE